MIVAEKISKLYGARRALSDVSFEIGRGEVVGFLGLNGAGKTTVLKILCGVLWPSAGRVCISGLDSVEHPLEVRRRTGFLPDTPPLYPEMTVRAMLAFAGRLNGVERGAINGRVDAVVARCRLTEVQHEPVGWLSHGYRKRVGIAQAIIHQPALVVLDEPTSGLDPEQVVGMRDLVRELAQDYTVLISSHVLSEIERTCHRLLVLHEGRLVAQGSEQDLLPESRLGRIEIVFRGSGDAAMYAAGKVAGVSEPRVLAQADDVRRLTAVVAGAVAQEALVKALVEAGLGVRRVREAGGGLESVFLALTRSAGPGVH